MNRFTALRTMLLISTLCPAHAALARQLDRTGSTLPAPTVDVPRESCVTAECHPGIKQRDVLHGPVRVNACESCHQPVDPSQHTFARPANNADACSLCHAIATIPVEGPIVHAPFSQGACLSCHDPHGGIGLSMLRGTRYADACSACHQDVTGAHDTVHGPASVGACGACHRPHTAQYPKLLSAQGRDLCLKCHVRTGTDIDSRPVVHAPALGDCGVCHAPHATDNPAVLIQAPAKLCTECHQDIAHKVETASTQHGAVTGNRACTNCHEPHAGNFSSLLKEPASTLCYQCHDQTIRLPDGTSLTNMKKLVESGHGVHGAISERGCVECHEIHGGGHRRLLTNEFPSATYYPFAQSSYALCFGCHDRQLVVEPRTTTATSFRNGDVNLHSVHVMDAKKGRSCGVCHDAHTASRDHTVRDNVQFGPKGWRLPIRFERLPEGGKCAGACHAPFEYNRTIPIEYPAGKPVSTWNGEDLVPGTRADPPPTNSP